MKTAIYANAHGVDALCYSSILKRIGKVSGISYAMGVEVSGESMVIHQGRNTTGKRDCVISVVIRTVLMVGFRPINGLGFVLRVALVGKPTSMISTGGY